MMLYFVLFIETNFASSWKNSCFRLEYSLMDSADTLFMIAAIRTTVKKTVNKFTQVTYSRLFAESTKDDLSCSAFK
jgi:hypothetical protein